MLDDTFEEVPVRDTGGEHRAAAQEKRVIQRWTREDIEDNYLKIYSENILLKQHGRKQEEKIKKMATKLLKLTNDNNKLKESQGRSEGLTKKDFDLKEKIVDLNSRIIELERENNSLKDKLAVARQQLASQGKKPGGGTYSYVSHRIDTGRGVRGDLQRTPRAGAGSRQELPRYGHSLLEEAREENAKMQEALVMMEERLQEAERESDHLKEQLRQQQIDKNEGIVKYKESINVDQRSGIQENVEIIKLQREIKEKSTKFTSLQLQYQTLEENLRSVKATNQHLLGELERLNRDLQDEHTRNIDLQGKLHDDMQKEKAVLELKHRLQLMEQECALLKANNESLMKSALDTERDSAALEKEKELRLEIAKLQAAMKGDLSDKGEILDKFHAESEAHEKLKAEMRALQIEFYTIKQKNEADQEKIKFYTSQSGTDYAELEEALALIKSRREKGSGKLDFLESTDEAPTQKKLHELEGSLADTVAELEKTRNMLLQQYNINKVYKKEVDVSTERLEEYKKEFESRAEEYARLLDIRQARIKKLEAQLRDVAYGTKPTKVPKEEADEEEEDEVLIPETLDIERGKNIFEIHVDRVTLSQDAQTIIGDKEPSLFVTYGFHEFETQTTPVSKGPIAVFKFTTQFKVDMDDIFLAYLLRNVCSFELHQAIGTDFRTLAVAKVSFKEIFEKTTGRVHGSASFIGNSRDGVEIVGTLEYSSRFIVPVEQALRLYSERVKALGYTQVNAKLDEDAIKVLEGETVVEPDMNHLYVKIERCSDLSAMVPDQHPSPYIVYKFFDFDDYDTPVIANSCNPEFSDNKSFKVPMSDDLDNYLKASELDFFVFDDSQEKGDLSFLGVARVPLTELSCNKAIRGPYQITLPDGKPNGTMTVGLRWFTDYKSQATIRGEVEKLIAEREKEEAELETLAHQKPARRQATNELLPVKKESRNVLSHVEAEPIRDPSAKPPTDVMGEIKEQPIQSSSKPTVSAAKVDSPAASPVRKSEEIKSSYDYSEDEDEDTALLEKLEAAKESKAESKPKPEPETPIAPPRKSILKTKETEELKKEVGESKEAGEVTPKREASPEPPSEIEEQPADEVLSSGGETTDSEQIVSTKTMRSSVTFEDDPDSVTIVVHSVTLEEQCKALKNSKLGDLFVCYKFLDVPLDLTETPISLEKPQEPGEVVFNFHKTFVVSEVGGKSSRDALKEMFVNKQTGGSKIRFDLVAEPKLDDGDCEDVGWAELDILELVTRSENMIEQDIALQDPDNKAQALNIGSIKISIRALAALRAVYSEMKEKKSRTGKI